jgi:hypothetical protein
MKYELTNEDMEEMLEFGKMVIGSVVDYLKVGRGNQAPDWKTSNGFSCYMTKKSREMMKKLNVDPGGVEDLRFSRVAWVAREHQAAYCFGYAALAYTGLRHTPIEGKYAAICVSWSRDHTFAAICSKDRMEDKALDDDDVVVDPWPLDPQPVLWRHHFCHGDTIQVLRCRPMDKVGGFDAWLKAAEDKYAYRIKYETPNVESEKFAYEMLSGGSKPKKMWNQKHCSNLGKIKYIPQ